MDGPLAWLTQLLGNSNTGAPSSFGSLGGMSGGAPGATPGGGAPGAPMNLTPAVQGQMPGLLGQFMNRFQPPPAATPQPTSASGMDVNQIGPGQLPQPQQPNQQQGQQQGAGNNPLYAQGLAMMKGPQFQPTQWMPWMNLKQ